LPAVSLLCAVAAGTAVTSSRKTFFGLLFIAALGISVWGQRSFFFEADPLMAFRDLYTTNPFIEAPHIAGYIQSHSTPEDRIAVIGSEPEIYFDAQRRSATGYIYMYPLMESQPFVPTMQKEMIAEIEASRPKFIVFVSTQLSWLASPGSDKTIIAWAQHYAHEHYRLAGLSDTLNGVPDYHWKDAEAYPPRSTYTIFLLERKE